MRFIYLVLLVSCLWACGDTAKKGNENVGDTSALAAEVIADTNSVLPHVDPVGSAGSVGEPGTLAPWIGVFEGLRKAILNKDRKAVEGFFNFPLDIDSSSIWIPIEPTEGELKAWKSGKRDTAYFDRDDFKRFYARIFLPELAKGLSTIGVEERFPGGLWSSKEFTEVSRPFQLHLNFDEGTQTLNLNVAFFGARDEQGNFVSEGEYSVIYVFDWDGKGFRFDRMVIAG